MSTNFRSEVFKLCKKLQKNETAQRIGKTLRDMSVVVEEPEIGKKMTNSRNDFAYIAQHNNTEFHGFLFLDDNIGKIEIPHFFNPEHLSHEERALVEQGHKTLVRLIELCLYDIAAESSGVANSMNPYFLYKNINISAETISLLSDDELKPAVSAFKNGPTYKALMNANFTKLFSNIDINGLRTLVGVLEREINHSLGEDVSKDLRDFSMKLHSKLNSITDVMFAFSLLMLALKKSLELSCRLLYRAICGIDLFVLNDDNIINIEKRTSNAASEFYKVFAQDIHPDFSGSEIGSVLLIDCDLPHNTHIHEFGMLIAETINFSGEFGESAKYSFVTVNEELIHIHHLVGEVLRVGLPVINNGS